jgi:F-type H+-transporting ATPase subunit gamma
MNESSEGLRRKIDGAAELGAVVRTMKALSASGISQYERAVHALDDYYRTVELGLVACLRLDSAVVQADELCSRTKHCAVCAVVFGSDQGLVGQYNEVLVEYAVNTLNNMTDNPLVLAVGERIQAPLSDSDLHPKGNFSVPTSIAVITQLVARILIEIETLREQGKIEQVYLFHNKPKPGAIYAPSMQRLLPLDVAWRAQLCELPWPTKSLPEIIGTSTLPALIREYLFISLFRACAEALASENASRLAAMQRAEKNIDELLEELNQNYNRQRQSSIDEELFDVISGFEALAKHR